MNTEPTAADGGPNPDALVVGAGPAGLMAAEVLASAGRRVAVYDAMPTAGRKFLLAGIGGLNLTHSEGMEAFAARYADTPNEAADTTTGAFAASARLQQALSAMLQAFSPNDLRQWAASLGIQTFVGSSGRVFPHEMKAAPLLRAWMHSLRAKGVEFHMRQRWTGWETPVGPVGHQGGSRLWRFQGPQGESRVACALGLLALGGASWPRLGSDGLWAPLLQAQGVAVQPLLSANCGFEVSPPWSSMLRNRYAGAALKSVRLRALHPQGAVLFDKLGECVLTEYGLEGSLVYAASRVLRQACLAWGCARLELDLLPGLSAPAVLAEVSHPRGSRSWASHLKSRLRLEGAKAALLQEHLHLQQSGSAAQGAAQLAALIKALPLRVSGPRPLAEAISTAGGVAWAALNEGLMLEALPGVFCAGEMLDWEAPTGGYLLQACLSSGRWAGQAMLNWPSG
jgi:uncharacterized flavoprotein (TIGR03862 family)